MTESEVEALRREMRAEFRTLNAQLASMEAAMLKGFDGVHHAIDGMAGKLLHSTEVSDIRATLKPPVADR